MLLSAALFQNSSTVVVPNIVGLTPSQALTELTNVELTVGSTSSTTSGANSSNNGTIASQTVTAGSLVERYSSVGYTTYSYTAPQPPPTVGGGGTPPGPSCTPFSVDVSGSNCCYYVQNSDCSTSYSGPCC
jgi:hypothetical protein